LTEHCPTSAVRAVLDGDQDWDAALWQKVAEMGWTATVIPEAYGGLGLSYYELAIIAEEMGRSAAPLPFSSSVYLASEAIQRFGTEAQKSAWLPRAGRVVSASRPSPWQSVQGVWHLIGLKPDAAGRNSLVKSALLPTPQ
jgi:acyl-CoA dehydrogenase